MATPPGGTEDRGSALIAIYWVECSIALIVIAMRLYSRMLIKGIGKDDYIMFFTMLLFLILSVYVIVLAKNGGEKHLYDLNPHQVQTVVRLNWEIQPFGILALATSKISVGFLQLRIYGPKTKWRKWFLYIIMVLTFIFNALSCIFSFAQCNPPRALWDTVPGARCWNPKAQSDYSLFSSSWNAFIDFCLALLPITAIYGLKLDVKKKVGLCILLGLGVFSGISACVKTSTIPDLANRADFSWATYDLYIWTGTEIFLLIICGSMPTLKPLYKKLFTRGGSSSSPSDANPDSLKKNAYPLGTGSSSSSPRHSAKMESRIGNSTRIYSKPRINAWEDVDSSDGIGLNDINVRNTVEVLGENPRHGNYGSRGKVQVANVEEMV